MPLPMTHPWKHPKTGIYWLRKRVPDELQALVGKREEKLSLRTRNPDEAKRLHAHVAGGEDRVVGATVSAARQAKTQAIGRFVDGDTFILLDLEPPFSRGLCQ